jgi:arylsulfatase A-like enzyme
MGSRARIPYAAAIVALALLTGAHASDSRSEPSPGPGRPNILWITTEDISPYLGAYGDALAETPNLDRLAAEGLRFEHAYANFPVCAPARSTLIFGVYASTLGTEPMRSLRPVPRYFGLLPQYLQRVGYYTTNNRKTDYNFLGRGELAWNASGPEAHWRNRPPGQPFFSVFNIETTHEARLKPSHVDKHIATGELPRAPRVDPAHIDLPPYLPDLPVLREDWARLYDLITAMDAEVGQRLQELEADGLADETVVFFFSDHGGGLPRSKRFVYDTGTRVPLLVRIPERFARLAPEGRSGVSSRLVSFVDFAPTVLSLAGTIAPPQMQGRAFLGRWTPPADSVVLLGRARMDERDDLVRAITDGDWRYIRNFQPQRPDGRHLEFPFTMQRGWPAWAEACADGLCDARQQAFWQERPSELLFHTASDPWEVEDLADDPAQAARKHGLRRALEQRLIETRDTGFIPESMLDALARPETPYDYARSDRYPIERIVPLAFAATDRAAPAPSLLDSLDDPHPVIRYWGLMACIVHPDLASGAAETLRRISVGDAYPSNRAAAATALARGGDEAEARKVLLGLLALDNDFAVLEAMNRIEDLGWIDQVPMATIRQLIDARRERPWAARLADYWHSQRAWRRWLHW